MEANKRNAMLCLTRARNVFMDTLEITHVRKVQSAMDEILTPAATSITAAPNTANTSSTTAHTSSTTANTSSTTANASSNTISPTASTNLTTNTNGNTASTNVATELSTNEQARHLILEAWDFFELAEDYTSADVVKKLGEDVFGEDAWGDALVKYVEEDAITKHPGVDFSA